MKKITLLLVLVGVLYIPLFSQVKDTLLKEYKPLRIFKSMPDGKYRIHNESPDSTYIIGTYVNEKPNGTFIQYSKRDSILSITALNEGRIVYRIDGFEGEYLYFHDFANSHLDIKNIYEYCDTVNYLSLDGSIECKGYDQQNNYNYLDELTPKICIYLIRNRKLVQEYSNKDW
ncbi:hypothetical protein [Flavobacterium sp.]|uniref:hypothetical protein n=1 Tax=Flavobacterium sp. TaxID=239 RepID=UPI00403470C2